MNIQNILRLAAFAGAILTLSAFSGAQTIEQRLSALEQRCNVLEVQVKYLNDENNKKTAEIVALKGKTKFMSVYGTMTTFSGCNVQIKKDSGSYWTPPMVWAI